MKRLSLLSSLVFHVSYLFYLLPLLSTRLQIAAYAARREASGAGAGEEGVHVDYDGDSNDGDYVPVPPRGMTAESEWTAMGYDGGAPPLSASGATLVGRLDTGVLARPEDAMLMSAATVGASPPRSRSGSPRPRRVAELAPLDGVGDGVGVPSAINIPSGSPVDVVLTATPVLPGSVRGGDPVVNFDGWDGDVPRSPLGSPAGDIKGDRQRRWQDAASGDER